MADRIMLFAIPGFFLLMALELLAAWFMKRRVYRLNDAINSIGLGVLWQLWRTHQVPIVPLDQWTSSDGFWYRARRQFTASGAVIGEELRGDEQRDLEQQRWQHLVPESENERSQRKYFAWVAAEHAAGRPAGPGIP